MRKLPFWFKLLLLLVPTLAQAQEGPRVEMQTSHGTIVLELYQDKAPRTVANFLQYVQDGFYNNTIFHRVINDFMIQGGGFTPEFERKQTYAPIINEADNGLENKPGTIAMARTADPDSMPAAACSLPAGSRWSWRRSRSRPPGPRQWRPRRGR